MNYPTLAEVEAASREQLARWYRFLPSPGTAVIERENSTQAEATAAIDSEAIIMNRICERFEGKGSFTPQLSKKIGWKEAG